MKKTIVYTGNFCIRKMNAAGKRVFSNAMLLKSLGYNVSLIGADCDGCEDTVCIDGIHVQSYPKDLLLKNRYNFNLFYASFLDQIAPFKDEVCIIICYGTPSLSVLNRKILKFARKNGIAFISDVVDWLSLESGSLFFKCVKCLDNFYLKGVINKKSDGIIAISSWFDRYYKKVANRVIIPPLTINGETFETENAISQIAYGGIPFRIGKIVKKKENMKDRFDFVINLLSQAKRNGAEFVFHVIGFTKYDLLYSLPMLQKEVDYLDDNIIFYGKLSMPETQNILKKMDYTILLRENNRSSNAGFSTKIAESISMGIPVITTKTSDVEKYLPEGHGAFYLNIREEAKSAKKLKSLLDKSWKERKDDKQECRLNKCFEIDSYKKEMRIFLENMKIQNIAKK